MFNRLKEPFGKAGVLLAIVALVAAASGGAWAAGKLTAKQKKEVTKIAKRYAGKPGPAGPQGSPGAAGAAGKDGTNGTNGTNGKDGTNGTNGVSPTGTAFTGTKSGHCTAGGVEIKGSNTTFVCNGTQGEPGPFVSQVPSEKTLKGVWSMAVPGENERGMAPITFAFPVSPAPTLAFIHEEGTTGLEIDSTGFKGFLGEAEVSEKCGGTAAAPAASPGFVCVYVKSEENMVAQGASIGELVAKSRPTELGVNIALKSGEGPEPGVTVEPGYVEGTWAVTAP